MKKINNLILIFFSTFLLVIACKKNGEEISDLDKLRKNNKGSFPAAKMDSAQAIQFITKQKIQELLDLSTLYANGNQDTEIDSIIYAQMKGYFSKPDSMKLKTIVSELDSLKVKTVKVGDLEVEKKIHGADTLDFARFNVEYFNKSNQSLGSFSKTAQYILKPSPVKFKKEFKFYFVNFDVKSKKDSISVGVMR